MPTTTDRLDHLEQYARRAEERLRRLELAVNRAPAREIPWAPIPERAEAAVRDLPVTGLDRVTSAPADAPASASTPAPTPAPTAAPTPMQPAPPQPRPSLEELLGGRVLAWVGGAAVLVGLAFLFALGVSNGWIGEGERCLIAAAGCLALLGVGIRLHERAGRTQAARAAVATGLAGLFLTLTVATSHYELLPSAAGIGVAALIGALAVALAIRWAAPVVAGLGVVGALLSPVLADVPFQTGGLWFLAVASAAAVAVLVWQRWSWLSLCVALVVTPQWLGWLADGRGVGALLLVLVVFGLLQGAAAVGTVLRAPGEGLPARPALLLAVNALVLGLAGWGALLDAGGRTTAIAWLAGLAAAHIALGLAARRAPRLSADLGILGLTLGVLLADVAFALAADGVVRALGFAAGVVAFAGLTRLAGDRTREASAAVSGLGLHVALAVATAAPAIDTQTLLTGGMPTAAATAMLAALAGACLVSARLAPEYRLGLALDVTGLVAAAVLAALSLDGVALTAAWALEAVALCALGARGADRPAWLAGLAHLAGAVIWCLADQASPAGLYDGVPDLGAAALGLAAVLAATARVALLVEEEDRPLMLGALAVGGLYLASLIVVDLGTADVRQGQLRLSGLWALVGVGALLAGLRLDVAAVRVGALALLSVTVVKVFVYDLATQEASYRVASFLGLGVLLLGAAFAYQRLRPEAQRDAREQPQALR